MAELEAFMVFLVIGYVMVAIVLISLMLIVASILWMIVVIRRRPR